MKVVAHISKYKYTISLTVFSLWVLFFDGNSALFMLITALFIGLVYFDINSILNGNYFCLIVGGCVALLLLAFTYLMTLKKLKS